VDLYVNSSGLMWENAQSFGAYLIWAEHRCVQREGCHGLNAHTGWASSCVTSPPLSQPCPGHGRYYGESIPTPVSDDDPKHPYYLSHEQALADYVAVLTDLQAQLAAQLATDYPGCVVAPGVRRCCLLPCHAWQCLRSGHGDMYHRCELPLAVSPRRSRRPAPPPRSPSPFARPSPSP
jgi:hypothetical protein